MRGHVSITALTATFPWRPDQTPPWIHRTVSQLTLHLSLGVSTAQRSPPPPPLLQGNISTSCLVDKTSFKFINMGVSGAVYSFADNLVLKCGDFDVVVLSIYYVLE